MMGSPLSGFRFRFIFAKARWFKAAASPARKENGKCSHSCTDDDKPAACREKVNAIFFVVASAATSVEKLASHLHG